MDSCDSHKPRDPAIKLFGRKIPLPESQIPAKPLTTEFVNALKNPDGCLVSMNAKDEHKVCSEQQNGLIANFKSKDEQTEATDGTEQEKVFKKPDKILPCPRCNSLDTKFCYFNNYNVNQPRHFCKNCQRYWTAGGTMRNVPIGAGRRKNKQFASQYRQILVSSDGKPISKIETADSDNCSNQIVSSVGNGTVLKFGSEAPLCQSMDTVLQLGDQKSCGSAVMEVVNSIGEHEQELSARGTSANAPVNVLRAEQVGLASNCSDVTTMQSSLPFYPVPPWGFPLNTGWNSVATAFTATTEGRNTNPLQFCPVPMLAMPGNFPSNMPLQFVPSSYFACRPILGDTSFTAPNGPCSSLESSGGSPTLGKHSRDSTSAVEMEMQTGKYILVPKMLRIDDRDDASKNPPIWASFGVLPAEQATCMAKGSSFKGLDSEMESNHVLEANPAALSRSHTFQEHT